MPIAATIKGQNNEAKTYASGDDCCGICGCPGLQRCGLGRGLLRSLLIAAAVTPEEPNR